MTVPEWRALQETEISTASTSSQDSDLYYEAAFEWSIVAMAQVTRSILSARQSQAPLFIVQAEDELTSILEPSGGTLGLDGDSLRQQVVSAVLRHTNMNETGRMPSFCLFHVGMSMRLTQTIEAGLIPVTGHKDDLYIICTIILIRCCQNRSESSARFTPMIPPDSV